MKLEVNGAWVEHPEHPGQTLLSWLREAGFQGPKRGCESGDCGCCTSWLNGKPVQACLTPIHRAKGKPVRTIEGLEPENAVKTAFKNAQGFQCGYCTAGMVMTLAGMPEELKGDEPRAFKGNLCRCTGYESIRAACQEQCVVEPSGGKAIGRSVENVHTDNVLSGTPAYTADFPEADMLFIKVLRSPHAHAEILSIDTTEALAMPGIVAVLTHHDVPRRPYSTACHAPPALDALDTFILDRKLRFKGQRVAVVIAESKREAARALEKIRVEYRELPAVLTPEQALAEGAPVIHDESEISGVADPAKNIAARKTEERGDFEKALAECTVTFEGSYETARQQHAHLEPHVATAWVDDDGVLTIRSSTQVPFLMRDSLCRLLELPKDKVCVLKPQVGGGFGNKQEMQIEDLVALATLKTGRPAHYEYTREEVFTASTCRHPFTLTVSGGLDAEGRLHALGMRYTADTGAYGNHAWDLLNCSSFEALAAYNCPNKFLDSQCVYTNTMPSGAFRGYGATQTTFALECFLDDLAEKADMDPAELRKKNVVRPGDPMNVGEQNAPHHKVGSWAVDKCEEAVAGRLAAFDPAEMPEGDEWKMGMGTALAMVATGIAVIAKAGARFRLLPDGRVEQSCGNADIGTGSDTTLRQIAADCLGLPFEQILYHTGDTARVPYDVGAYASGTMFITGKAVEKAATLFRVELARYASILLKSDVNECIVEDGRVRDGENVCTFAEIAAFASKRGETVSAEVEHASDPASMSFAVQGVRLAVNLRTGVVKILQCIQALDVGTLINPAICRGQAVGGAMQSLGMCLFEDLVVDETGAIENAWFRDYRIAQCCDAPAMETIFFESPDPWGPAGAKAIGELTSNSLPPAFANALKDALGFRIPRIPASPTRIWEACRERGCG